MKKINCGDQSQKPKSVKDAAWAWAVAYADLCDARFEYAQAVTRSKSKRTPTAQTKAEDAVEIADQTLELASRKTDKVWKMVELAADQCGSDLAKQALQLLREWRSTPFFDTREAWALWVEDFGARVDKVIKKGR